MADVTVSESATVPGESYLKSFFSDLPTDYRFAKCVYQQVQPNTPLTKNTKTLEFILTALSPPMCYLIDETLMSAQVLICKKDKTTLPDKAAIVGPINNALLSLFSSCDMRLNDLSVSHGVDFYAYKSYLSTLLTFGEDAKHTLQYMSGKN